MKDKIIQNKNVIKYVLTDRCNASCSYCPYKDQLVKASVSCEEVELSFERLWPLFDNGSNGFDFVHFFGGEASLCMDVVSSIDKHVMNWCSRRNKTPPRYLFSSNLINLAPELLDFFDKRREQILIITSVDGRESVHNTYRQENTFHRIVNNVNRLKNDGIRIFNATSVYHRKDYERNYLPYDIARDIVESVDPATIMFNLIFTKQSELALDYNTFYEALLDGYRRAISGLQSENELNRKTARVYLLLDVLKLQAPNQVYFCDYGIHSITVFPGGKADICPDSVFSGISPRVDLKSPLFDQQIDKLRSALLEKNTIDARPTCSTCEARNLCYRCHLWSQERLESQCRFAKAKASILQSQLSAWKEANIWIQ